MTFAKHGMDTKCVSVRHKDKKEAREAMGLHPQTSLAGEGQTPSPTSPAP